MIKLVEEFKLNGYNRYNLYNTSRGEAQKLIAKAIQNKKHVIVTYYDMFAEMEKKTILGEVNNAGTSNEWTTGAKDLYYVIAKEDCRWLFIHK